jgi:hypothetical protein
MKILDKLVLVIISKNGNIGPVIHSHTVPMHKFHFDTVRSRIFNEKY